jgi:regulator of protease activity HflC (stomatin/prohibitin superfamily)
MKRMLLVLLLLCGLACTTGCVGCTRIEPGHVGLKVNLYGQDRGVEDVPLVTGRVWYNPWTTDIYEFPTFMQNVTWEDERAITFNATEGMLVEADVAISYSMIGSQVPHIFVKLRKPADQITDGYLRNKVRDAFSRVGSSMNITDVFGPKLPELVAKVKEDLQKNLGPEGFDFDTVAIVGGLRGDPRVQQAINATIQATQEAIGAENKVRQVEAEAKQAIALADGKAKSAIAAAEGEAKAITLKATAQAEANKALAASVTPDLIQYEMLRQWNGVSPQIVTGGGGSGIMPMIQLPQPRSVAARGQERDPVTTE